MGFIGVTDGMKMNIGILSKELSNFGKFGVSRVIDQRIENQKVNILRDMDVEGPKDVSCGKKFYMWFMRCG